VFSAIPQNAALLASARNTGESHPIKFNPSLVREHRAGCSLGSRNAAAIEAAVHSRLRAPARAYSKLMGRVPFPQAEGWVSG
jgi:hypothetical protein